MSEITWVNAEQVPAQLIFGRADDQFDPSSAGGHGLLVPAQEWQSHVWP